MKAKIFLLATVIVVIVSGCVSCATPPPSVEVELTPSPEPVTIQFWEWFGGAWGDFFEEEAKLFNARYPWITIEVSHYPDQKAYREAVALAFQSGNAPDVFLRRHSYSELIENNWVQPLDQWITPEWLAKFPSGSFVETRNVWDGKVYAFPSYALGFDRVLFLNEDLFREANLVNEAGSITIPQTWSDLRSMAKQITESGRGAYYGVGIGIKNTRHMSWWFDLASLAGAPPQPDFDYRTGHYTYGTDPAYAQVVELLLGMKEDGSVYPYEGTLDDSNLYAFFAQGKFAMYLSGSYTVGNLRRGFPDFQNYRIVPLPIPDEGRQGSLAITPGQSFYYMSSQTKHPDESWLWLDWVSSRDFHKRMVTEGLNFSIYGDLNTPKNINDTHSMQAYEAMTKYAVSMPFPPARNPQIALVRPKSVVPSVGEVLVGIYTEQIEDWRQALEGLETRKQAAFEDAIREAQTSGAEVSIEDFIFPDWDPTKDYITESNE